MSAHKIVERMMDFAARAKSDAVSVAVSHAANRLAHQGALFEEPLTPEEISIIKKFIKKSM